MAISKMLAHLSASIFTLVKLPSSARILFWSHQARYQLLKFNYSPVGTWGLRWKKVLCIPMRVVKADWNGSISRNNRIKGGPVSVLGPHVQLLLQSACISMFRHMYMKYSWILKGFWHRTESDFILFLLRLNLVLYIYETKSSISNCCDASAFVGWFVYFSFFKKQSSSSLYLHYLQLPQTTCVGSFAFTMMK